MPQAVVMAGFGNVGQAVAELIAARHPAARGLQINGVVDPRFGSVVDPDGVDPGMLLAKARDEGSFASLSGSSPGAEVQDVIDGSAADTLVELTFTDLDTGEPATSHVRHALSCGLNVSTTNKGPIALHLGELEDMAAENDVLVAYEGTVMSGTPAVLLASESIRAAGFRGLTGILNGTTNYMITRMEAGGSYDEALAEAQESGFAEADPSGDVEGHDIAGKISILARVLTEETLPPSSVERTPLRSLSSDDIVGAVQTGKRWRYLAVLEQATGGWRGAVEPRLVSSPLASVTGPTNAITFTTDLLNDVTLTGPGAGRAETAYSVLNDLARIAKARSSAA